MRSIQARISLGTGLAVVAAIAVLSATSAYTAYETAVESASANALGQARLQAATVKAEIEVALDSARAIAHMLSSSGAAGGQSLSRDQVIGMLREVTARNPSFLGVYTGWEPNAFDSKDAAFSGSQGHDRTGRFLPYLVRGADGNIGIEPLADLENQERGNTGVRKGEYYLCPKESGAECVLDPFFYEVNGRQILMTSITVPIVAGGRFVGIAGVDIAVDTLQKRIDEVKLARDDDRLAIVSSNGRLIAARGRGQLDGKPASDYLAALDSVFLASRDSVRHAGGDLVALAPSAFGRAKQSWTLAVIVPYRVAVAGAWSLALRQLLIGLAVAAVSIVLIVLVVAGGIKRTLFKSVNALRDSSQQVVVAARQIASGSRTLASESSSQAAALEETSASSNEINTMANRNADDATAASKLVDQAQCSIEETHTKLNEMVSSMAAISESSGKISKIISAIDAIAFQTNILALNAAVEAARAGEAGMGFAVVADEVRSLAQRCADSARDTSVLIQESIEKSNQGRLKVQSVVQSVSAITGHATQLKALVESVALSSQEQARGVEQISRAIQQMETGTQHAAANAEEYSAVSREIESQVQNVRSVVAGLEELIGANPEVAQ